MDNAKLASLIDDVSDHRVVTAEALRLGGADPDAVARARGNGTLQDVPGVTGVYVVGPEPFGDVVRMHVAVKKCGEGSVITGIWAARLLKMRWVPEQGACMVRVDATRQIRGSEGFISVCRTRSMGSLETWEHEGLLVATAPLAVTDAGRQIPSDAATRRGRRADLELRAVRGVVLGAVSDGRCSIEELEQVLSRGSVRWTAHLRRALVDARRGAASPPEAEVVDGLLPYGVPFYCNVEVWLGDTLIGVLDFYLLGTATGGEMDSVERHDGDQLDRTLVRDDTFKDVRIDLRHITPSRYRRDPDAFHRKLLAVAAERLAAGHRDPAGLRFVPRGPLLCGPLSDLTPYRLPVAA